jgi:hypothetical protein
MVYHKIAPNVFIFTQDYIQVPQDVRNRALEHIRSESRRVKNNYKHCNKFIIYMIINAVVLIGLFMLCVLLPVQNSVIAAMIVVMLQIVIGVIVVGCVCPDMYDYQSSAEFVVLNGQQIDRDNLFATVIHIRSPSHRIIDLCAQRSQSAQMSSAQPITSAPSTQIVTSDDTNDVYVELAILQMEHIAEEHAHGHCAVDCADNTCAADAHNTNCDNTNCDTADYAEDNYAQSDYTADDV